MRFSGESWANIKQTLALMLELVGTNRYARATPMHLYAPYPGTPLFDEAVAQGWEKPATLEEWAAVDFHSGELPWLDEETKRRLRRMTVSTYFLDGRTMPEYFSQAPMMRAAAAVYGAVVRWRARRNNFHLMPELWLMEQYRRVKAMA
ncbi:MAG: hypothetical protein M5R36_15930 [Deltaproteobacteria bacterium]|nr:hypothetical protein [Deltaproteobacteria bacterium]